MRKKEKVLFIVAIITVISFSIVCKQIFNNDSKKSLILKDQFAFIDVDELLSEENFQKEIKEDFKTILGNDYEQILINKKLATNIAEKIDNLFQIGNRKEYPNYYGGMYIDDNGNLTLKLVKSLIPNCSQESYLTFNKILFFAKNINIEYVENSYNELDEINNRIISYFSKGKNIDGFIANYIDEENNTIIVELEENTSNLQQEFKTKVVNSELISFVKGQKATFAATTLKAGGGLPSTSGGPFCSVGFRAKLNGTAGFVTAGHCVDGYESIINGVVMDYKIGGTVDSAFVATAAYSPSNLLNRDTYPSTGSIKTNTSMPYLTSGSAIAKVGITSNATTGVVNTTSWSGNLFMDANTSVYFTNIIKAQQVCQAGDSGGVAFTFDSTGSTGGNVIGTISACQNSSLGNYSYIIRMDQIISKLGITRY